MDEENNENDGEQNLADVLRGPGSLGDTDSPMSPEEREARNVDAFDDVNVLDLGVLPFGTVMAMSTVGAIFAKRNQFVGNLTDETAGLAYAPWRMEFLVPVDVSDEVLEMVGDKFARHVASIYANTSRPCIGTATARELGPEYLTANPEAGHNQFVRFELAVEYGPEGLIEG